MTQRTTYQLVCDNPAHGETLVDGDTTLPVTLPNKGARVVELCEPCRGTVTYAAFIAIVVAHGRVPGSPPRTAELVRASGSKGAKAKAGR